MIVHPVDYRYGTKEMKRIWSEESRIKRMIRVEIALLKALAKKGYLSEEVVKRIAERARKIDVSRVKEIENEIKHDVMALVRAVAEVAEDDRWIHFGATSNDIIDTAVATQLRDTVKILEVKLAKLALKLVEKAEKYKSLVCLGRTHGQAALPTTYGFRFALWASEVKRHLERLEEMKSRVLVGQMSGAVGTQAAFDEEGFEIEEEVMKILNLKPAEMSSQIIPRDIYCEFVSFLANVAATLEKIATNVRLLQRAETAEVFERFEKSRQVGSSTMPHKRNPIDSEQICGLARIVRGFVEPQFQSSILWEERDLTNSSAERIILVETSVLLDHILTKSIKLVEELGIDEKAVRRNLERQKGLNMSEAVMVALTKKGMSRQEAHELLRRLSMKAYEEDKHLKEVLIEDETVRRFLSEKEIEELLKPENYLGTALKRVERVVESVKSFVKRYLE